MIRVIGSKTREKIFVVTVVTGFSVNCIML